MPWRLPIVPRLALTTGVAALIAIAPGWSSATWASAPTTTSKVHHTIPLAGKSALSGKWSGTYSGSFSGTFTLKWQQTGSNLSGTIMISAFKDATTNIHGTVQGNSIRFGTVGSESITYSGSVSGKSMSGTWKLQAGGRSMGGGSWKASKSS